jgi:hypothetical protein
VLTFFRDVVKGYSVGRKLARHRKKSMRWEVWREGNLLRLEVSGSPHVIDLLWKLAMLIIDPPSEQIDQQTMPRVVRADDTRPTDTAEVH